METIDAGAFKELLALFPSGVTVVTTTHESQRLGMTVAAFSSVSLDPPLVLVCIANKASARAPIEASGRFAVNFLAADQVELARRFAGMIQGLPHRFDGVETEVASTGAPILPDCAAFLDCLVEQVHPAGDHTIFVGRVVAGKARGGEPLVYHARTWRTLTIEANR